ncbi:hypothetical protein C8F04DRAFT_1182318 [Mycena alexandri]|uniref:Uncharacterized protein n=1 Tax=Mycena alexandri TaxID=1745969 RepID=A0AAD6X7W9_9AGAR|nr:hypothetical protein C8F04DRAFT_1182318 [Mycena alexandri]
MYRTNRPLLGYVEIAFNQVLPKVYAISMMYTLNARRAISTRASGSRVRNGSGSDGPSLEGRVQPRHTNGDVELGRIEVVAQRETTRHVDFTDMFASTHSNEDHKSGLSNPDQKIYGPSAQ